MARVRKEISKKDYGKVGELAGKGLSVERIAAYFGLSKATMDRRIADDPQLKAKLNQGRSQAIEMVASVAFDMAVSGKHPAMTMFWLKCNANWKEKESFCDKSEKSFVLNYNLSG